MPPSEATKRYPVWFPLACMPTMGVQAKFAGRAEKGALEGEDALVGAVIFRVLARSAVWGAIPTMGEVHSVSAWGPWGLRTWALL